MHEMVEKKKTLTVKVVPLHIQKLKDLKDKLQEEQRKEKDDKPIPLYQKEYVVKAFEWLYKNFPLCFMRKVQTPLKVNILQDIFAFLDQEPPSEDLPSKRGLRSALSTYVRNRYYLKSCVEGASRVDLQGSVVSLISCDEALYAKDLYDKYTDVLKERKRQQKHKTRKHFSSAKNI